MKRKSFLFVHIVVFAFFPNFTVGRVTTLQNVLWSDSSHNGCSWTREQAHGRTIPPSAYSSFSLTGQDILAWTLLWLRNRDAMFFPNLSSSSINADQLIRVGLANMRGLAFKCVATVCRNWHMGVFILERYRDLFFLLFVLVRFEIIYDCLRMSSCFLFWPNVLCFMIIALPFFNDTVASLSESSCVKKALSLVFPCSTILCL